MRGSRRAADVVGSFTSVYTQSNMVASDLSRGASEFAEPNEPQEETVSALMARLDWRSAACWVSRTYACLLSDNERAVLSSRSATSILKPISEDVRNALDKGEMPKILCDSEAEFEQGASTRESGSNILMRR